MTHPAQREAQRTELRRKLAIYRSAPPRITPMPTIPAMVPGGPSWAVWALGAAVLLCLLSTALATVYARSAPMVDAVSDDGGGRVP